MEDTENSNRKWYTSQAIGVSSVCRCRYAGAVGHIGFDGNMNTGLTLRTIHIDHGVASVRCFSTPGCWSLIAGWCRAGATLLYHSDPDAEEAECRLKASAFLGLCARLCKG